MERKTKTLSKEAFLHTIIKNYDIKFSNCLKDKNNLSNELNHVKKKYKKCKKTNKPIKPKQQGGLKEWQIFLTKYRTQNPTVPFRQAQKQASVLYKQQ